MASTHRRGPTLVPPGTDSVLDGFEPPSATADWRPLALIAVLAVLIGASAFAVGWTLAAPAPAEAPTGTFSVEF